MYWGLAYYVYVTFRLSVYVPFGHCGETDRIVEEVSGVTFEESFQDLPIELGR